MPLGPKQNIWKLGPSKYLYLEYISNWVSVIFIVIIWNIQNKLSLIVSKHYFTVYNI